MDWQTAFAALGRSVKRYQDTLAQAGNDRAEAASLLWKRSRRDTALREDLAKTACALLSMTPAAPDGGTRIPRPRRTTKLDRDPEIAAFVTERLGRMTLADIASKARARFGPDRSPSKSAIHYYWHRLTDDRGPKSRLNPT